MEWMHLQERTRRLCAEASLIADEIEASPVLAYAEAAGVRAEMAIMRASLARAVAWADLARDVPRNLPSLAYDQLEAEAAHNLKEVRALREALATAANNLRALQGLPPLPGGGSSLN